MSRELADQPVIYQLRLRGHLGHEWRRWFGDMRITWEAGGDTLLTGPVADQAALHGLLRKVRDLGLPLVALFELEHTDVIQLHSQEDQDGAEL